MEWLYLVLVGGVAFFIGAIFGALYFDDGSETDLDETDFDD